MPAAHIGPAQGKAGLMEQQLKRFASARVCAEWPPTPGVSVRRTDAVVVPSLSKDFGQRLAIAPTFDSNWNDGRLVDHCNSLLSIRGKSLW